MSTEDSMLGPVPRKSSGKSLVDGCDLCDDNRGPMYLHGRCHMTAPLEASLEGDILTLRCYVPECRRIVARMRVAEIL